MNRNTALIVERGICGMRSVTDDVLKGVMFGRLRNLLLWLTS
jgi:hypothetical protein